MRSNPQEAADLVTLKKFLMENFIFVCSVAKMFNGGKLQNGYQHLDRSSPSEVFLGEVVLKICHKFTGEVPKENTHAEVRFQ